MRIVRPACAADLDGIVRLFSSAGDRLRGLTSLSSDRATNEKRLADAEAAMHSTLGDLAHFLFVLEDSDSGEILGTAGIGVPGKKLMPAFLVGSHRFCLTPHEHFDAEALTKSHMADGCGEFQSLFLSLEARGGGLGTLLSRSRMLLIAEHPERFPRNFVSELRGVASPDGTFPFWEGFGRHFTGLSSRQAEQIVADAGSMALGQMLPDGAVPVSLLQEDVRAVLGKVHPFTEGAERLLMAEGFEPHGLINVLDAGPMPLLKIEDSASVRRSLQATVLIGGGRPVERALIVNTRWNGYRATLGGVEMNQSAVTLAASTAAALELDAGDEVRILRLGGQT